MSALEVLPFHGNALYKSTFTCIVWSKYTLACCTRFNGLEQSFWTCPWFERHWSCFRRMLKTFLFTLY